jgi:cell division protein FtsI/penicillin-binding protein 2
VRRAATFSFVSELEERIRSLCAAPRRPWSRLRRSAVCLSVVALALLLASVREAVSTAPALAHGAGTDARLQRIVDEEAERTRVEWAADDVVVVVLDPNTGSVLSQLGRVGEARVPGSTLKPFVVAAALEAEKVTLEQRFDTSGGARKYGTKVLEDYAAHASLDLRELLMVSSNVGASRVYDALGGAALLRGLVRLHLGDAPGARPERLVDGSYEGAMVASGEGVRVSPLELAAAYGTLVDGTYRVPSFTSRSESSESVLRPQTARDVRKMLESAVHDPRGTGGKAALPGVRVAGKTGTSNLHDGRGPRRTFASFAGLVPAEAPRFVVYVGVVTARAGATGGKVAAPLFARIAARSLAP